MDITYSANRPPAGSLRLSNDANRLVVIDPNGVRAEVKTIADAALLATYPGEPVNYVAAAPSTKETVFGASTIVTTSILAGTDGDTRLVNLTDRDPGVPNAPLLVVANANELDVFLETNGGDAASVEIVTSGTSMVVESPLASTLGNGGAISFSLPVLNDLPIGPRRPPSVALTATLVGDDSAIVVLGTGAGTTSAKIQVDESVVGSGGSFKIEQKAAYLGTWFNEAVRCRINLPGTVGQTLGVVVSYDDDEAPTVLDIAVNLATTAEGLPDDAANTDTLVVAAINAALGAKVIAGALDWGDVLLCTKLSSAKIFSSPNPIVTANDGVDPAASNTANAVANVKTALELLGFDVTTDGTGYISASNEAVDFAGGGLNYASVSTVADVVAAVNATVGREVNMALTAGDGADVIPLGGDPIELAGGVDMVAGTPALLGRLATDGTDVWTALTDDPTETQAGWVKTFTA